MRDTEKSLGLEVFWKDFTKWLRLTEGLGDELRRVPERKQLNSAVAHITWVWERVRMSLY